MCRGAGPLPVSLLPRVLATSSLSCLWAVGHFRSDQVGTDEDNIPYRDGCAAPFCALQSVVKGLLFLLSEVPEEAFCYMPILDKAHPRVYLPLRVGFLFCFWRGQEATVTPECA